MPNIPDITLRFVSEADAAELAAIYAPYIQTPISFEYEAPDAEEFARRIRAFADYFPFLAAERGGEILGYAYAHRYAERAAYQWSAELSVYVKEGYSRLGIGTKLYKVLIELLRMQRFQTLYARISASNATSIAMHKALGFEVVGMHTRTGYKLGAWHDVATLEMPIGSYEIPPQDTLSVHELGPDVLALAIAAVKAGEK
jgi:phosphinothricin acetyltransferase